MPRYFDSRDKESPGFELDDGLEHADCSYFAVYGSIEPFCAKALSDHEIKQ